jgi:DNA-binding SARP family transcriptional activator
MPLLQIRVFGRFSIQLSEHPLEGFDHGSMQKLFCYLLLHRDRPQPLDVVVSRFWGDERAGQAKRQLQHMIWHLQVALGDEATPARDRLLLAEADWVRINPRGEMWLDVEEFERGYDKVKGRQGETLDVDTWQELQRTAGLYRGDLLEGYDEEWCVAERERLRGMMMLVLEKLMDYCEIHTLYELGAEYGERILVHDKANERVYRKLMRMHYLNGDRAGAMRQYERCKAALSDVYGGEPRGDTVLLYDRIKADLFDHDGVSLWERTNVPAYGPVPQTIEVGGEREGAEGAMEEKGSADAFSELEARFAVMQRQVSDTIRALRDIRKGEHLTPEEVRARDHRL